ncbi:hypothetical protein JCM10207_001933 [Rhodosporidiobolus poonsookiae]
MEFSTRLPRRTTSSSVDSPSRLPRRARSGTIAAPPAVAGGRDDARNRLEGPVDGHERAQGASATGAFGGRMSDSPQDRASPWESEEEKRSPPSRQSSSPDAQGRLEEARRREAYQALALRQLEREARPTSMVVGGSGARKKLKKWLILVVPPDVLPHSPPPLPTSGFANGYGAPGRYSGGILLPLQPTLSAQVSLVAREFALPSIAGVCLYLCLPTSQPPLPLPAPPQDQSGYPFPPSAHSAPQDFGGTKPRLTDDTWSVLWSDYFDTDAQVEGMGGVGGLPIAGRIEFDIDVRRARWLPAWQALPPATPESFQAVAPRSPAFETSGRPRFGTSLSYNRPITPASEAHVSELYTFDEEGEMPESQASYDGEPTVQLPYRQQQTSAPLPQTSTPRSHAPRPLSLMSQSSSVIQRQPSSPRSAILSQSSSRASTPRSLSAGDAQSRTPTRPDPDVGAGRHFQSVEDSGFAEQGQQWATKAEQDSPERPRQLPTSDYDESISLTTAGEIFDFPRPSPRNFAVRPPTPPRPLELFSSQNSLSDRSDSETTPQNSLGDEGWTAQLDRLRTATRTEMVEGVEHPSHYGSFDGTASIGEILLDIIDEEQLEPPSYQPDFPSGMRSTASPQPAIVVSSSLPPLPPVLSPSAPGYPYNLSCLYPDVSSHAIFRLFRLVPVVPIPPRHAVDLSPILRPNYPFLQLYPAAYPHVCPYPPIPSDCAPPSTVIPRLPRPPPIPLPPQRDIALHASLDSWPPTPPSPERFPSPSLEDRLCLSGGHEVASFATSEEERQVEEVRAARDYERPASLVEADWDMAMHKMTSLQAASALLPVANRADGDETYEDDIDRPASPTLVEDDPFQPIQPSEWTEDDAEDDDDDFFAAYGSGRPLSAIVEESEVDATGASMLSLAGPEGARGFFGGLAGESDEGGEDGDQAMGVVLAALGHGENSVDGQQGSPQLPAISFYPSFEPPKIIYSAATATPSPSSSRYSASPPRSPDFHSPIPSPTVTPARHRASSSTECIEAYDLANHQPEVPRQRASPPPPLEIQHSAHTAVSETDDYTLEVDATQTRDFNGDEPYALSPSLQRALGLEDSPAFGPTGYRANHVDSDEDHSDADSQYAVQEEADESCRTYDHLSPLPPAAAPEPVLFAFPPTEQSSDFVDAVAQFICEAQMQSIERRGRFTVALSGYDPLPELLSQALVGDERMEFDKWEVFFTEDTIHRHDHPSSTVSAYSPFLRRVPIPASNIHVIRTEALPDDLDKEVCPHVAEEVVLGLEEELLRTFPESTMGGGPPRFDMILLGSCASLAPNHPLLNEQHSLLAPVVGAAASPTARLTFTLPLLCNARRVAFLATSSSKRAALANMLDPRIPADSDEKVPAGRIALAAGQPVIVFVDEAAVEGLPYPTTRFWDGDEEETY